MHFTAMFMANPPPQAAGTVYFAMDVDEVLAAVGSRPSLPCLVRGSGFCGTQWRRSLTPCLVCWSSTHLCRRRSPARYAQPLGAASTSCSHGSTVISLSWSEHGDAQSVKSSVRTGSTSAHHGASWVTRDKLCPLAASPLFWRSHRLPRAVFECWHHAEAGGDGSVRARAQDPGAECGEGRRF